MWVDKGTLIYIHGSYYKNGPLSPPQQQGE
jgi:hypothetical protein